MPVVTVKGKTKHFPYTKAGKKAAKMLKGKAQGGDRVGKVGKVLAGAAMKKSRAIPAGLRKLNPKMLKGPQVRVPATKVPLRGGRPPGLLSGGPKRGMKSAAKKAFAQYMR